MSDAAAERRTGTPDAPPQAQLGQEVAAGDTTCQPSGSGAGHLLGLCITVDALDWDEQLRSIRLYALWWLVNRARHAARSASATRRLASRRFSRARASFSPRRVLSRGLRPRFRVRVCRARGPRYVHLWRLARIDHRRPLAVLRLECSRHSFRSSHLDTAPQNAELTAPELTEWRGSGRRGPLTPRRPEMICQERVDSALVCAERTSARPLPPHLPLPPRHHPSRLLAPERTALPFG